MTRWPFHCTTAAAKGDSDVNVSNGATPAVALTCVAATNMDGQGARWAEGGRSAVNNKNGQEVHILFMAVKAWLLGTDASCVVLMWDAI